MKRRRLFVAALALGAGASAATAQVTLIPEYDATSSLSRPVETTEDFRAKLSISIFEDTRQADARAIGEIVRRLDLRTTFGSRVVDATIEPASGAIIGIDKGSVQFIGTLPDGSIIVSVRDDKGAFTRPEKSSIVLAKPDGTPLCFDMIDIARSEAKMSFVLLIDRSGSMKKALGEVAAATRQFLKTLPGNAQCSIISFALDWKDHTPGGSQRCDQVRFDEKLEAKGGTDIYGPLATIYGKYAQARFADWQKAVIVITDGAITANLGDAERLKAELERKKGDVSTFVYWAGQKTEKHLAGLADHFIAQRGEISASLAEVYHVIGDAYGKQSVLAPRACTGKTP